MRKFLNALCVFALVAGCALMTSCNNSEANAIATADHQCEGKQITIAYVDLDTLIANYEYAKELEMKLVDKIETDRANLNSRVASLAKRQEEFQRKVQNNSFLSQSSAEQQYNALMQEQEKLQADAARIDAENMQAQQQMMKDLSDAVRAYINEYNKTAGYDVIFDRAATLYIGEAYNITQDIIKGLNKKDKKGAVAATDTTATK